MSRTSNRIVEVRLPTRLSLREDLFLKFDKFNVLSIGQLEF